MSEPEVAIETISRLGRACLATYYDGQKEPLDKVFADIRIAGRTTIRHDGDAWTVVWWRNG